MSTKICFSRMSDWILNNMRRLKNADWPQGNSFHSKKDWLHHNYIQTSFIEKLNPSISSFLSCVSIEKLFHEAGVSQYVSNASLLLKHSISQIIKTQKYLRTRKFHSFYLIHSSTMLFLPNFPFLHCLGCFAGGISQIKKKIVVLHW
jgi:hypothetical protein